MSGHKHMFRPAETQNRAIQIGRQAAPPTSVKETPGRLTDPSGASTPATRSTVVDWAPNRPQSKSAPPPAPCQGRDLEREVKNFAGVLGIEGRLARSAS